MNKAVLRSASLMLAAVLAFGSIIPGRATSQFNAVMPNRTVNLAFFYKPPSNSNAATVARNFGLVVLTGGDENFRKQLSSNGFNSTVPQYVRFDGIQNPGSCTSEPANNQIANRPGDFCSISKDHPDWFLLDTNRKRMRTSPTSNYYRMDPGNAGWRKFFVSRLVEIQKQKGWSGLFLDNVEASLSEIGKDGLTPAKYRDDASYRAAVRGFLQYLDQNYSQKYNRPVLGNIIARKDTASWDSYVQSMSGAMQERWAVGWSSPDYVSESKWKSDLALAESTQSKGKFIILVSQGDKTDANRQKFAYASYLLIANGKAAFRYTDEDVYSEVWLYDNYKLDLGAPAGPRYQTGTSWRRDFAKGYVVVDPVNHTAAISTAATTQTYDDRNASFDYSSGWMDMNESMAYGDSYKLTKQVGSSISINFTGKSFTLIYKTGPMLEKMEVYVDGKLVHTLDQNTSSPGFQQKWSYRGRLTNGTHKLKLIFVGPSGGRGSLDAVSIP